MSEGEGHGTPSPRNCFEQDLLYWMGRIHGPSWLQREASHVLALYRSVACFNPNECPRNFIHLYPEPRVDDALSTVRSAVRFDERMRLTLDDP